MKGCNILLAGVLSFGTFGNAIADLNSGLVAYYPFNGNANDESGNSNHGEVNGAILVEDRFGSGHKAYEFNGAGNNIVIKNSAYLNQELLSISTWVKISKPVSGHMDIISKDGEGRDRQYLLTKSSLGTFRSHIGKNTGEFIHYDGQTSPILNSWYHIVQTYDGETLRLYINGEYGKPSFENKVGRLGVITSNQPVRIGGGAPSSYPQYWFSGVIDDVRIYNRALSESEVQELYNVGSSSLPDITSSCRATYLNGKLHIPYVDVLDPFTGSKTFTYNVDMQLLENRTPLTFELRKAVQQ